MVILQPNSTLWMIAVQSPPCKAYGAKYMVHSAKLQVHTKRCTALTTVQSTRTALIWQKVLTTHDCLVLKVIQSTHCKVHSANLVCSRLTLYSAHTVQSLGAERAEIMLHLMNDVTFWTLHLWLYYEDEIIIVAGIMFWKTKIEYYPHTHNRLGRQILILWSIFSSFH